MNSIESYRALRYHDAPVHAIDLHSLLNAIRDLFRHVYHEGLRQRMQPRAGENYEIEFPSITAAVEDYIAPHYVASNDDGLTVSADSDSNRSDLGGWVNGARIPEPSPLADRFRTSKRLNSFNHNLGEQLYTNASRHLSRALCLSRHQRKREAKLHARLAEAAVNEARNYLTQEEFLEMKCEFDAKLAPVRNEARMSPGVDQG